MIVHWFRRDLRVSDNTALTRAAREDEAVLPVFILDDHYRRDPDVGPARRRFLRESLEALDTSLQALGSRLALLPGPASKALPKLLAETGARAVYANAEIGPHPEARDREAQAAVRAAGGELLLFGDALLVEPDLLATASGDPYVTYTPFSKRWLECEKRDPEPGPGRLSSPLVRSVPIARVAAWRDLPAPSHPETPRGGEDVARRTLEAFLEGRAARYGTARDLPALDGTSRLSPHLHFGTISPRTVRAGVLARWKRAENGERRSLHRFVLELCWREFFHHVLFHFPHVATRSFREELDALAWAPDAGGYAAWREGKTGYPFIDAGMRQLAATHWMHNRARMAVASFLTKDLHLDWRLGERWFAHELADADLANNNGGWQWAAGTGVDAAPYFRIFNPILQSKRFDPRGAYIRAWVPELSSVPDARIHEPWTMSALEQREAHCAIGPDADYPAPILDHARERVRALAMFEAIARK